MPKKGGTKIKANPARGFATTSIPSKNKAAATAEARGNGTGTDASSGADGAPSVDGASAQSGQGTANGRVQNARADAGHEGSGTTDAGGDHAARIEDDFWQEQVDKVFVPAERLAERQIKQSQADKRVKMTAYEHIYISPNLTEKIMSQPGIDTLYADAGAQRQLANEKPEKLLQRLCVNYLLLRSLRYGEQEINEAITQSKYMDLDDLFRILHAHPAGTRSYGYKWRVGPTAQAKISMGEGKPKQNLTERWTAQQKSETSKDSASRKPVVDSPGTSDQPPQPREQRQKDSSLDLAALKQKTLETVRRAANEADDDNADVTSSFVQVHLSTIELQATIARSKRLGRDFTDAENELKAAQVLENSFRSDVLFDKERAQKQLAPLKAELYARLKRESAKVPSSDEAQDGSALETESPSPEAAVDSTVLTEADAILQEAANLSVDDDVLDTGALFDENETSHVSESGRLLTLRQFNLPKSTSKNLYPFRLFQDACKRKDKGSRLIWSKPSGSICIQASLTVKFSNGLKEVYEMGDDACTSYELAQNYLATSAIVSSAATAGTMTYSQLPKPFRDLYEEKRIAFMLERDDEVRKELKFLSKTLDDKMKSFESGSKTSKAKTVDVADSQDSDYHAVSAELKEQMALNWEARMSSANYLKMLEKRSQLPMAHFKEEILNAVSQNQVIIICGETGSGKSTQVPAYIMEHGILNREDFNIVCTEPRRISALSLAQRVSEEVGDTSGACGTMRSHVGYAIRLESKTSKATRLTFATTGIVLRMLESSKSLGSVSHLIIDEVHERGIDTDFLLVIVRKLLQARPDLRVILMSATVDAERLSKYMNDCPVLNVPGRTFPVEQRFLEDAVEMTGYQLDEKSPWLRSKSRVSQYNFDMDTEDGGEQQAEYTNALADYSLETRKTISMMEEYRINYDLLLSLLHTVAYGPEGLTVYSGAILVFLPGLAEIRRVYDSLVSDRAFGNRFWRIYPLHSSITSSKQESVFEFPPIGVRKIVLATNIAETGITIPDITCVIDAGKMKEMRYDEKRQISRLVESFISRANAQQRRGRAGRVQPGLCFHLFTRERYDNWMADHQIPEIKRLSLQELTMRVKTLALGGIDEVLSDALDPPASDNIRRAVNSLIDVGALTPEEELTVLGRHLAMLPVDVYLAKIILYGLAFNCLDVSLIIAASLSTKSPFQGGFGKEKEVEKAKMHFARDQSDFLTVAYTYFTWRRICSGSSHMSEERFCSQNFLSSRDLAAIEDLRQQYIQLLVDAKLLLLDKESQEELGRARYSNSRSTRFYFLPESYNACNNSPWITSAVVGAGLYPKIMLRDGSSGQTHSITNSKSIAIHPTSVNSERRLDSSVRLIVYYSLIQSKKLFAQETAKVDPYAIALLCGDSEFKLLSGQLSLDHNRLRYTFGDTRTLLAFKILRSKVQDVIYALLEHPGEALTFEQRTWLDLAGEFLQCVEDLERR